MNKLAEVLGAEVEETVKAVKVSMFNGVIDDTRVDTGRLRANWQTSTGSPASGTTASTEKPTVTQGEVTADNIDYLTNNLDYAEVWEERDGMVARNAARIQRYVKEQTRD